MQVPEAEYRPELSSIELISELRDLLSTERHAERLICRYLADLADRIRARSDMLLDAYVDVSGISICCDSDCGSEFCASEGAGCVQCEVSSAVCLGSVSQQCVDGTLEPENCGNGRDPQTGFCEALLAQGAPCTADAQCGNANCDVDIDGNSRRCPTNCAQTGRVCGPGGTCVCSGNRDFVNGACRLRVSATCTADGDCGSGACEPTQFAGNVCCSSACPGLQCRGSGQGCGQLHRRSRGDRRRLQSRRRMSHRELCCRPVLPSGLPQWLSGGRQLRLPARSNLPEQRLQLRP